MKNRKNITNLLCIILLLLSALLLTACSSAGAGNDAGTTNCITQAELTSDGNKIHITATLKSGYVSDNKNIEHYLIALSPNEQSLTAGSVASAAGAEKLEKLRLTESVSVKIPLKNGVSSRLYSSFAIAAIQADGTFSLVTDAFYVANPERLAENRSEYPSTGSIKGLRVEEIMTTDAAALGISHAIISVPVEQFIAAEYGEDTVSYIYNGVSCYLNGDKIESLDRRVSALTDMGVNVYFSITLDTPYAKLPEKLRCLAFEDAAEAAHYAINLKNEQSVRYVTGLLDYLADRYTDRAGNHGFVGSYIIGSGVNNAPASNSAGALSETDYIKNYISLVRLADTVLRSHYENGRVFISTSNKWKADSAVVATNYIASYNFLDNFILAVKTGGDFPWNVSSAAYASDISNSSVWYDDYITGNCISPIYVSELTDFLATAKCLYNGAQRHIIIGDFAINAVPGNEDSEQNQAASYAYSYLKTLANGHIDALIYSAHTDNASPEGLNMGLWECDDTQKLPTRKKAIYDVFANIDVSEKNKFDFVATKIGESYSVLYSAYGTQAQRRTVLHGEGASMPSQDYKLSTLYSFNDGKDNGFITTVNAKYSELARADGTSNTAVYRAVFDASELHGYSGITNNNLTTDSLADADYISLRLSTVLPEGVSNAELLLTLSQSTGGTPTLIYEGSATIVSGEWNNLNFDISKFCDMLGKKAGVTLSVMIKSTEAAATGEYDLCLESITLKKMNAATGVIFAILAITVFGVALVFGIVFFFRHYEFNFTDSNKSGKKTEKDAPQKQSQKGNNTPAVKKTKAPRQTVKIKKQTKNNGDRYNYADDYNNEE